MATASRGPSVHTREIKQPIIFIPPDVFALDGSVTINGIDYSDRIVELRITGRNIRDGTHDCTITLNNEDGFFINDDTGDFIFDIGQEVIVNYDYGSGTTRLFKGKSKYPYAVATSGGHFIIVEARTVPEMADRKISYSIDGSAYAAVVDLIDTYLSSLVTYSNFSSNLSSDDFIIRASYNSSVMQIISDIFKRANWQGYLDFDSGDTGKHDLIGFGNTQKNNNVNLVSGQNLTEVTRWGKDANMEYNTIRVVGKNLGGSSIIRTIRNNTLINKSWRRDKEIKDNTIVTLAEAKDRAIFEKANNTENKRGTVTAIGHPDIVPAKTIKVSSQVDGIFGDYQVLKYTHIITNSWTMTVDLVDRSQRFYDDIIERKKENERLIDFDNPNGMEYSINLDFDFDTDNENNVDSRSSITYSNSLISISSGTVGSIESEIITTDTDLTSFDYKLKGPVQFVISTVEVSNDGGVSYVTATTENEDTPISFTSTGNQLRVRVVLRADGDKNQFPSLDGFVVRAK